MAGNVINVRVGKLQDATQEHLNEFLDHLAEAPAKQGRRPQA